MADMMMFPNTVEEFMEQYKIVDDEKVYTNGADLVPIFRMMQWFEHVSVTDKNVGNNEDTRTGKWIKITNTLYKCDRCGAVQLKGNYCKDCGVKMNQSN